MLQITAEAQRSQRYLFEYQSLLCALRVSAVKRAFYAAINLDGVVADEEFGFTVTPANAGGHIDIVSVQK